ncbi:class I SAM-dependent methyltransferase [Sphingomonas colocasiae]|uniref:Class I SAM-dependent methyltransferase n=1 Tax=Sphingomonas colocasiae TaxID=1848973 RepID=A0ABS7PKL5_9SPHN|nr:class I SAM-dependent methyltransferase [Sphingomonas colocasiae]MBY8821843.1 class I SAM-dependent methyltransferase [Sphingomonas colocasiae]
MFRRLFPKSRQPVQTRDTDRDWAIIGEKDPYFGVITNDKFKRENLDDAGRAEFFRTGKENIDYFLDRMRAAFGPFTPRSALDFGCGVGRLTVPLAEITGTATGVDVSQGMLAEARKHDHPDLRFVETIPDERFDWVVSLIVLQHIPPERGYEIIRTLLDRVAPDGGATIQIMFGRAEAHANSAGARLIIDPDDVRPARSRVKPNMIPRGRMMMYDYDLSRVIGLFYISGMKDIRIEHCDHGGIIGATIYARKRN